MARETHRATDGETAFDRHGLHDRLVRSTSDEARGLLGRGRALEVMRKVNSYYAGIIRAIADPMFVTDTDLNIVYMNEACAAALGYSADEVVGRKKCHEVFRSNICETSCAIKHCMRTGESITGAKVTIRDRAGAEIPILCSASAILDEDGNVIGGMEIARDISEDVRREREVADREEYYSSILESIALPMFVADKNLTVVWMNDACEAATGWKRSEVEGKMQCSDVFQADICHTSCALKRCMGTGAVIEGARVNITTRSGQKIPIMCTAGCTRDAAGNVTGGYEICKPMIVEAEVESAVREASLQLSASSEQVAAGTQNCGTAAEEIARAVQGVAGDVEAVTGAAARGADIAQQGKAAVLETVDMMARIRASSEAMRTGMEELNAQAEEVGQITEVIDAVAEQTNLLALNAAIEAARAGEHGKGFAVVAEEVRKLAEQAGAATGNITKLIRQMQQLTAERVREMNTAAEMVAAGTGRVEGMASAFDQVAEAIAETNSRAQNVSAVTEEVAASTQEMNATFEEIAASSEELSALAQELTVTAARLGE